jgi:hypothetical protein
MSALRFLGSYTLPPTATLDDNQQVAIFPTPGVVVSPVGSATWRYPKVLDPDGVANALYRVRVYKAQLDWHAPVSAVPGYGFEETGSVAVFFTSAATVERELISLNPGTIPAMASGGEIGTLIANPGSTTSFAMGGGLITHLAYVPGNYALAGSDLGAYFVDPATQLYLPQIAIALPVNTGTVLQVGNYLMDTGADPGLAIQTFTGSFLGTAMDVNVVTGVSHPLDTLTFVVTGFTWWAHANSEGAFWNTATGASLRDYRTFAL